MKWFKHMTAAHRDPKLIALVDEFGMEGYGMWWMICEVVAEQYEAKGLPELETSAKGWRKLTGIYPKKFEKVVRFLEKGRLLSLTFSEKGIKVQIHKMKELKDNYSRNLQATYKQEEEAEEEVDIIESNDSIVDSPADNSCPHKKIIALYHKTLPELRRVRSWNQTRQGHLRSRWKESEDRQSLDWWRRFFEYVKKSPFLIGLVEVPGRKTFQADLEWLVRPNNFQKVIEGKYHD